MGRSSSYWQGNRYPHPSSEPAAAAPLKDLPTAVAARFRVVREGLKAIPGVIEHVKFLGPQWLWAWEYTLGTRKLCWMHVMQESLSVTFTVSDAEERRVATRGSRPSVVEAISAWAAHRAGPVVLARFHRPAAGVGVPRLCEEEGGMDAGGGAAGLAAARGGMSAQDIRLNHLGYPSLRMGCDSFSSAYNTSRRTRCASLRMTCGFVNYFTNEHPVSLLDMVTAHA